MYPVLVCKVKQNVTHNTKQSSFSLFPVQRKINPLHQMKNNIWYKIVGKVSDLMIFSGHCPKSTPNTAPR